MPRPTRRRWLLAATALLVARSATARPLVVEDIVVHVEQSGSAFDILVSLRVPAPQLDVWNVLTDFDRMAGIVSNLETSRVLSRSERRLVVEQSGSETQGPLRFSFHSIREVELSPPSEMQSRLIRGSMRQMEGWTRLASVADGTVVDSRGHLDPGRWVPPLIAPHFMERATRRQYAEMRDEMLRRAGARGP